MYKSAMKDQLKELVDEFFEIRKLLQQPHAPQEQLSLVLVYRASERNLQLLIEMCIGIAKQLLKSKGKNVPNEARKAFEKLVQEGLDDSQIPWNKVIGMRNAIVHDYLNIDRALLVEVIVTGEYLKLVQFVESNIC